MDNILSKEATATAVRDGFFRKLASDDPGDRAKLAQAITEFTNLTLRDEGIMRRVLPPTPITFAELDKEVNSDKPVKFVNKEVLQPLSASVPFATLPRNFYMHGARYKVQFGRTMTRNFVGDIAQLENWGGDIRETFKEQAIKDHSYAEDIPFFATLEAIVKPSGFDAVTTGSYTSNKASLASPLTGKVQYWDYTHASRNPLGTADGFTRATYLDSFKNLQQGFTVNASGDDNAPIRLAPKVVLMNANTAIEFQKLDHDAFGGPGAEDLFKSGVTETTWNGKKHIFTLKDDIVPDGIMWVFPDPSFIGKFYELESPTMFFDKRAFMVEFFIYALIGSGIGNPFGVSKIKFF